MAINYFYILIVQLKALTSRFTVATVIQLNKWDLWIQICVILLRSQDFRLSLLNSLVKNQYVSFEVHNNFYPTETVSAFSNLELRTVDPC